METLNHHHSQHHLNCYSIDQKMTVYNFNASNRMLKINQKVTNLTINGSGNRIIAKAPITNLIVVGSKNEINIEDSSCSIANLMVNGDKNQVFSNRKNSNFNKMDNGRENKFTIIYTQHDNVYLNSSDNSRSVNYSIVVDNPNSILEIITNTDKDININIYLNHPIPTSNLNFMANNIEFYSDSDQSYFSENLDEFSDEEEDFQREKANREYLLEKMADFIQELNIFQFKHWDKFSKRTESLCSICLENFKINDICKQFACSEHFFHKCCLDSWLKKSDLCPLCKYDLMEDIITNNND